MSAIASTAVGYLRVSSPNQPLSMGDQRGSIVAWAAARGFRIIRWYEDDAISGVGFGSGAQPFSTFMVLGRGDFRRVA